LGTKRFASELQDFSARPTLRSLIGRARMAASSVTFDLDFGDILALGVLDKPSVIIFRLADERADSANQRLSVVLTERVPDLESGALIR
jgi:hypothetical protein